MTVLKSIPFHEPAKHQKFKRVSIQLLGNPITEIRTVDPKSIPWLISALEKVCRYLIDLFSYCSFLCFKFELVSSSERTQIQDEHLTFRLASGQIRYQQSPSEFQSLRLFLEVQSFFYRFRSDRCEFM